MQNQEEKESMTILSFEKDLKSNKYFYLENEIKEKNDAKTIEIDSKKSKLTIKLIKKFETDIIEISSHPYSNSTLNFNTDTIFYIDFKISPEQEKIKISPISPTPFSFVSFAKIKKNQEKILANIQDIEIKINVDKILYVNDKSALINDFSENNIKEVLIELIKSL